MNRPPSPQFLNVWRAWLLGPAGGWLVAVLLLIVAGKLDAKAFVVSMIGLVCFVSLFMIVMIIRCARHAQVVGHGVPLTCPNCGYHNDGADKADAYRCPECGVVYSRDEAARMAEGAHVVLGSWGRWNRRFKEE